MHFFRKELAAIIILLSVTLFLSSYSDFVAEGNAISRSQGLPSWAQSWAAVPWDVQTGETLVSASYQDSKAIVTASGTYIWTTGYIWNPRARQWRQFTFPHNTEYPGWSSNEVIAEIPVEAGNLLSGGNYVLAYTCQWKNERWYCGCLNEQSGADGALLSCGRWQLQTFGFNTTSSCSSLRTKEACDAVPELSSGVRCVWKDDIENPFCLAVSDGCSQMSSLYDCGNSNYQGLRCDWNDASNQCVNSGPSTISPTARLKTASFGSMDEPYCPGFTRDFTMDGMYSIAWKEGCPEGCVASGGVSSPLYCTFPGRYYTRSDVAAIRSTYMYDDTTNNCLSISSYCDCMSGNAEIEYCRRRQGSDGIYMRTLGDVHGCTWSGDATSGFCTTVSQALTISRATELRPRGGQACSSAYSVRMGDGEDRNKCFACTPDGIWMQVQERQDIIDPTICDTGVRADAGIVSNFIGAVMRESQLNTEEVARYEREVLPRMRRAVEKSRIIELAAKYTNDERIYSERHLQGNDEQIIASINDGSLRNFDEFYYTDYGIIPKGQEFRGCSEGSLCSAGSWTDSACLRRTDGACYVCSRVDDYSSRPGEGREYSRDDGVYVGSVGVFMDHGTALCKSMLREGDGVKIEEVEFNSYENNLTSPVIRGLFERVKRGVYKVTFSTPQSYDGIWEITNYDRTEEIIVIDLMSRTVYGDYIPQGGRGDSNTLEFSFTMRRNIGTTTEGSKTYTRYEEYSFNDRDHDGRIEPEEFEYRVRLVSQDGSGSIDVSETSAEISSERVSRIKREINRQIAFAEERARENS